MCVPQLVVMEVDTPALAQRKGVVQTDDDLYSRLKRAQRQVEMLDIQEEYIKDEMKNLKRELIRAQEEIKRIQVGRDRSSCLRTFLLAITCPLAQSVPLTIGQFMEMIDADHGIVSTTSGQPHYVRVLSVREWA